MTTMSEHAEALIADVTELQARVLRKHTVAILEVMQEVVRDRHRLERENVLLRRALTRAREYLRNDRFDTRVVNALSFLDEAIEAMPEIAAQPEDVSGRVGRDREDDNGVTPSELIGGDS